MSPPALLDVKRVCDAKLLGVYFRHDFNFFKHSYSVVATCNQRLYLLGQLAKQGLGIYALDSVFKATVLNKISYALPVCFTYLTEGRKDMVKRVLKRPYRMGFTFQFYDLGDLNKIAQYKLFRSSRS